MALAFAPLSDSIRTKFFLPIVKGRIACSAYYSYIRISIRESNQGILRRQEELTDDRYDQRGQNICNHLQYCGNCKSQQPETVRLCAVSLRGDSKAHGRYGSFFHRESSAMVCKLTSRDS